MLMLFTPCAAVYFADIADDAITLCCMPPPRRRRQMPSPPCFSAVAACLLLPRHAATDAIAVAIF